MPLHDFWLQIRDLTLASIKSRYRKTWAGFLWVILNPILMFGVQALVFKNFLKLDVPHYYLFLLGGLLPWIFFTQTVQMGTPVFVIQAPLLKSFKINPWVILGSQVLDGFINFMASFIIILLPFYFEAQRPILSLLLLPLATLSLLIGTLSFTIIASVLNIFFRDINFVMGFVFSILFFLTPVFYPTEYVPPEYHWIVKYNPIVYFIEPFRTIMYDSSASNLGLILLESYGVALLLSVMAFLVWKRKQNEFYRAL